MKARFIALMALVLGLASCQTDMIDGVKVDANGEAPVTIQVGLPQDAATRAAGADSAKGAIGNISLENYDIRYILAVYDKEGTLAKGPMVKYGDEDNASFTFRLVPGRKYHFVAWADFVGNDSDVDLQYYETDLHYDTRYFPVVSLKEGDAQNLNDESRDAYTQVVTVEEFSGASSIPQMVLTRPFAKLRVVTTDMDQLYTNLKQSTVTYTSKVYTSFNALSKVCGDADYISAKTVKYTANENDMYTNYVYGSPANGEMTLFADYLFGGEDDRVMFKMYVEDYTTNVIPTIEFNTNIPIERNHLTTVKGNVLTDANNITVTIDDDFTNNDGWNPENDKHDVEVWDGESIEEPVYDEATKTYTVESGAELAWFAAAVNGTLPPETRATVAADSFAGKTFVLESDVDLGNEPWTPIGTSENPFKGTFDGNNKKIANLVVGGGSESNKGLFGYTTDGEIKNLVIENAKVSGRLNIGVVAGTPYTSKYTNITVQGHVEVDGLAYVGAVGGKNAYADWNNITVNVDETSYVKAHSIENGSAYRTYVGGVCGFNGEGGHSFKNITSNINVMGSTCDVGGLFGIAHYSNKFENCVCTGDVEIYAAEEAEEAQEIGGIAGVWHNATGYSVEMMNCSFEGTLKTNIEGVNFYYGGLVGKPYGDGEGKLMLNGVEFTKDGVNFEKINEVLANGFVMPFDLTGKATTSNAYGVTGLNQVNGGTLDGDSHTLKVTGAGGTWGSAISTTGGTIKNVTVAQGFRGIFINHNSSYKEKVVLENVTIDGPTYTISCDQGMYQGLEATDCTINGWTSYAATIGEVKFTNCSFGKGAGYKFARPYAKTVFEGCKFCEGYEIDARAEVTFINCTLNGVALTSVNVATLVTGNTTNAVVYEDVETAEELVAALKAGKSVRFLNDITIAATEGGYHKAGILQNKAQTIDGNGHTLTVTGAGATWDCAIYTNGGVIKNLIVAGAMRGIFTAGQSSDLTIDNVTFKNVVYTFNSDGDMPANPFGVYVSNSVVNGWTSHSDMHTEVVYTNCSFGEGSGYKFCRPYGKTAFVNCTFCPGYTVDKSKTTDITFTNCTFEE